MTVIEILVVVGKRYGSSEHPAAFVLLNEILGSNDCAEAQRCGEVALGGRADS
jgi:hypothetical protein